MKENVITLRDADFRKEVLEAQGPVLVDFTAQWCPPCRAMEPTLDALAADYAGRLTIARMDVDENQDTAEQYGIRAMPTMLLFKQGRVVGQIVGAAPRSRLEAEFRKAL